MRTPSAILKELASGKRSDVLFIVPPFGGIDRPALGVHILQAAAKAAGFEARILYANVLLAARLGLEDYNNICYAPTSGLLGERFFVDAAFPLKTRSAPKLDERLTFRRVDYSNPEIDIDKFEGMREIATDWCDEIALAVSGSAFQIVGCTTTFEQTNASLAILNRIKAIAPSIVTILGGANCEGEMAVGLTSLAASVDYIFSGESEHTFVAFLQGNIKNLEQSCIIEGAPNFNLNDLPTPDFDDYYRQVSSTHFNPDLISADALWLPYESSRGCWWGQKHHCTFCGINGQGMAFREKAPDRVIEELSKLVQRHPSQKVMMVDNIMPHRYFESLLPRLPEEVPGLFMFYEQKANLTLEKVELLHRAGVAVIQPGIESLSTPLLKLMKKGVTASQNIALLRYAAAVGLGVNWNLLFGFPHDDAQWYEELVRILPYIRHLPPPGGVYRLSVDRFSPYFDQAEKFGLSNVRPGPVYEAVFPTYADLEKIAYHFEADYFSGSLERSDIIDALKAETAAWMDSWKSHTEPKLLVSSLGDNDYILYDSRGLPGNDIIQFVDRNKAEIALTGRVSDGECLAWGLNSGVCLTIDGKVVPLSISSPNLLRAFEKEQRHNFLERKGANATDLIDAAV